MLVKASMSSLNVTEDKTVSPEKTLVPIALTPGALKEVIFVQPEKALLPSDAMSFDNVTSVKVEQL